MILHGYTARTIPKEYGGYGAEPDILKSRIIAEEFSRAGIPAGLANQGISMLVPTLLELGTEAQKRQWIEPTGDSDDRLAICAVFHDLAAWPDDNLDYLRPSADQADAYLDAIGRSDWKPAMRLMIESHHKITPYRAEHAYWVGPARRADWCDVSFNLLRFGLPATFIREVNAAFPIGVFYPGHVARVSLKWVLRHPLNPLLILRW